MTTNDHDELTHPRGTQSIDFSMVLASAVHDMKNSLGMLLNSLDELRQEQTDTIGDSPRFNTLQYEAERMHNDLVQLLGIYRLGENNLSAHVEEHFVPDFLAQQMARHTPLLEGMGIKLAIESDDINGFFDGYPENMQHNGTPSFKSLNFNSGSTSLGLFFASSVAQLHSNGDRHGYIKLHNDGRLGGGVFEIWLP